MKYLLYYKLDSKFVSDQMAVGGDGTKVVSVVDGVAWTDDEENVYYRLNGEASAVTSYTVTVYYRYVSGSSYTSVTQQSVYAVNCYSGYSAEVTLFPKQVSGYVPKNESTALTVSGNMTYVFEYQTENEAYLIVKYVTTANSQTVKLYEGSDFTSGLSRTIIDDGTTKAGENIPKEYTFGAAGTHTVKYLFKDLVTMPYRSFYNCSDIVSISFPNGLQSLPGEYGGWGSLSVYYSGICEGCSSLSSVTLPDTIKNIGQYCFCECTSLTEINLPLGLTSIGGGAFYNTKITEVVIPSGVTSLTGIHYNGSYRGAFGYCTKLTKVSFLGDNMSFGDSVFESCGKLTGITIPKNTTNLGQHTFNSCYSMRYCNLNGAPIQTIRTWCFGACSSLTGLTLPPTLTSIEGNSFGNIGYGSSKLLTIISFATTAPSISQYVFGQFNTGGTLYYPQGSDYSSWMNSGSSYLGGKQWNAVEMDKVINVEYVEATAPAINDGSSAITTDLNLSDPDAFARFKAVFSFYMPSMITGTTRMISSDKFITLFYNNGGSFRETSYRLNPNNVRIVEHDTFSSAPNTSGANILCVVYNYKPQGHGSYYKITGNLTSPQNNYPYSSFDSYNTGNTSRLYYNYTETTAFADTTIQLFKQNIFPGTRFYGLKIYGYGENDAEPTTVVYDFVPVYNETQGAYGFFEKNNLKFYTREDLTGPAIS